MYYRKPAYIYALGGEPKKGFIDCSEFVRKGMKDAGVGVTEGRTQAWRIFKGMDRFVGDSIYPGVLAGSMEICDLLCLAVPGSLERPYGVNHVGAIIQFNYQYKIIHASGKRRGIAIDDIEGMWIACLPEGGHRRLR